MSGGSFDYLCYKEPSEILNALGDLERMTAHLARNEMPDAAQETYELVLECRAHHARVAAYLARLQHLWQAVEWDTSGDSVGATGKAYSDYIRGERKRDG
jgi:hypothetical protein